MDRRTQGNVEVYSLLQDMIKDTDEQPGEEIPKVRSGKVPSAEASVPVELEEGLMRATLHVCTCFAGLRALGALYTVGGFWRLSQIGMVSYFFF